MQRLHLVGFTSELDGLIFSARRGSRSGGFVVTLDEQLLASIREAIRLQSGDDVELFAVGDDGQPRRRQSRIESGLSPKEIQARLRAGRTVGEVADEADVDEEWVRRFASPVLAEQALVVTRALTVPVRANRKGESAEPLAESVAWNLMDRGQPLTDDELARGWGAHHVRDSSWVVRFRYRSRRGEQTAQWGFDLADGSLVPLNRLATDLGWIETGRRRRRVPLLEASAAEDRRPTASTGAEGEVRGDIRRPARPSPSRSTKASRVAKVAKAAKVTKGRKVAKVSKASKASKVAKVSKAAASGRKVVGSRAAKASSPPRAGATKPTRTPARTRATKATKATKVTKAAKTARAAKTAKVAKRAPVKAGVARRANASPARSPGTSSPRATTKRATKRTAATKPVRATKAAAAPAASPARVAASAAARPSSATRTPPVARRPRRAPAASRPPRDEPPAVEDAAPVTRTAPVRRRSVAQLTPSGVTEAPRARPSADVAAGGSAAPAGASPTPTPTPTPAPAPADPAWEDADVAPSPMPAARVAEPPVSGAPRPARAAPGRTPPPAPVAVHNGVRVTSPSARRQRPLVAATRARSDAPPLSSRIVRSPAATPPPPPPPLVLAPDAAGDDLAGVRAATATATAPALVIQAERAAPPPLDEAHADDDS